MGTAYDLLAVAREGVSPVGVGTVVFGGAMDDVQNRRGVESVHDDDD
jgi:hypothetical protein